MTVWVWREGLGVIPKDEAPPLDHWGRDVGVMRDQPGFVSPIDRSYVDGRRAVREHEKRHNVFQVGNDLKPRDYDSARRYGFGDLAS